MFCFFFKWLFDSFLFLNNFDDGVLSSRKLFFIKMLQQTIAESVKLLIFNLVNFPPRSDTLRAILQESEAKLEMKIFNPSSIFVWR